MSKGNTRKRPLIVVLVSVICFLGDAFLLYLILFVETKGGPALQTMSPGELALVVALGVALFLLGLGTLLLQKWAYYVWFVLFMPLMIGAALGIPLFAPPPQGFVLNDDVRKAFGLPPYEEEGKSDQTQE